MKRDQAAMPVRVEEDEPSVEHQNALLNIIAPAITGAMKQGLEDAIHDRFSGLWFIGWLMRYVTPTSWMTAVATRELISFLSGADWAQWWYYVPDDIWDNWKPFFIRFAPVMKDVQLRRSIYWWRSVNLLGLVGLFITSICSFVWGFNQSRLWWIATFGLVVFGAGARIATLHVTAYSAICRRKDALRRMGEASREEWSPRMKRLYNLVQNLVGLITIGGLGYFCYDHMTRSAELETTNRVEVKPKRVPDKKISLDQSMEGKEKRPPLPDDDDAPRIDFQNFIEISDEEMRRRNDVRNVWEDKVATYRSHYRNPGQTHEQLCKKVEANLSTILCQVNGEWEFCSNLLWICTTSVWSPRMIYQLPPKGGGWLTMRTPVLVKMSLSRAMTFSYSKGAIWLLDTSVEGRKLVCCSTSAPCLRLSLLLLSIDRLMDLLIHAIK